MSDLFAPYRVMWDNFAKTEDGQRLLARLKDAGILPPTHSPVPSDDEDKPTPALDELYDGYQALGEVLIPLQDHTATSSYELGYLDAWADAMQQASWAYEGQPVDAKGAFALLGEAIGKKRRKEAAEALMARRAKSAEHAQRKQEKRQADGDE